MNPLAAIRALMEPVLEGQRMTLLGPDYRQRRERQTLELERLREQISGARDDRARMSREEMNKLAVAVLESQANVDAPETLGVPSETVVGPMPPTIEEPTAMLQGPGGTTSTITGRSRQRVLADLAAELGLKSEAQVGVAVETARQTGALPPSESDKFAAAEALKRAGVTAAASARRGEHLTIKQRFDAEHSLARAYTSNTKVAREVGRQFKVMEEAMGRWDRGEARDLNATTQAIITPFNRIMDPASVVRESEYARSPSGQAFMETLQGKAAALARGGPGVTPASLREFVELARVFQERATESVLGEQERLRGMATDYGLNPDHVFQELPIEETPRGRAANPASEAAAYLARRRR